MKKILSLVCALVLLLTCIGPVPAKAAADTMTLSSVFLRSAEGKEGIFFGAYFNLSQDTINNMARYGLALTPKTLADDDAWTAAMDGSVQRSWYETGLTAGVRKEVQSTSLVNIINISNDSMTNNRNANTVIYVRPYVEMKGGSFVYGDIGSITMKEVAQMVDVRYSTLTDTQKRGLLGMYERFTSCMKGWGLSNIKADYPYGTDVNGESLILQYRRNKAVANMTDQNNVLWSFTTEDNQPIQYSRVPTSFGLELENQYDAESVYTLYPGRIYRGIPYTHGSAGLDAFKLLAGSPDANGVYTFQNFHGSYFSGASASNLGKKSKTWTKTEDGKEVTLHTETGMDVTTYNVSRLGNDCWDAVYWAWAGLGNSVTAGQTQQMTESYGLKLLGEDILAEAMKGFVAPDGRVMGEGENAVWEFICNKSSAGLYGYRSINNDVTGTSLQFTGYYNKSTIMGLSSGTYTIELAYTGAVDGTALVRYATQKCTGELYSVADLKTDLKDLRPVCDYQALYQTYALTQPGDAMVHFENTQGHAIMVVDMNVVYNQDGTINGDESTITLLEQGSGHEKRQSKEKSDFTVTSLSTHNSHEDGSNDNCLYCAGYIEDENIWALDYGRQVRSFKTMAEANYLAVTCEELINPAAKIPASRITDSKSSATITGVYSGTLASTYRVSHITLDVFDEAGAKINSSTCFGIQSGNTDAFSLSRFVSDQNAAYGSVLKGEPVLEYHTYKYVVKDSEGNTVYNYKESNEGTFYKDETTGEYIEITGNVVAPENATLYTRTEKTATATWLEAPNLPVGAYSYSLTCVLANGYTKTFRSGFFTVGAGTTPVEGNSVTNMVFAD